MNNSQKIDLSPDRLIALAADMVDKHNYIDALRMLNKNRELSFDDEDSLMLYAEIYDDLGLYEKCINGWFRYLDVSLSGDLSEAYEGLAVAFLNIGNERQSAYYYNKMLLSSGEIDAASREEIMSGFLRSDKNPLHFVYPPRLADFSREISDGIGYMKESNFEKARKEFEKVDEENEKYPSARNYIAMCNIFTDKCEEAEWECRKILDKHPDNVQALTTLVAVKTQQEKLEESREIALKLLKLNVTDYDDLYKIATVCCENKMHAEAYEVFKKLGDELEYDLSVMYFKAVSAYNCGKYAESYATFNDLLTIYPEAVVAKINYTRARIAQEEGKSEELSYFYRLPAKERESTLKLLAALSAMGKREREKFVSIADISACIKWCFDEVEPTGESELHLIAAECAVWSRQDDYIRELLLNAFLVDSLKINIIAMLAERNEDNRFGVAFANVYKSVITCRIKLGRAKRKFFMKAYARLLAHFSLLNEDYCIKIATATEILYKKIADSGKLNSVKDADSLSAAIYVVSQIREDGLTDNNVCKFFDVAEENLKVLLESEDFDF